MNITASLRGVASLYPDSQAPHQRRDIPRIAFNIGILTKHIPLGSQVADLGGGLGLFSPGCSAVGFKSILVDDFRDPGNVEIAHQVFSNVHNKVGVEIVSRDVIAEGIEFPPESLDAVTSFDSMEHWHHSPKRLFRQVVEALKPGGVFILSVPNCVNLRKRISVPLGSGKWSTMEEWYEQPTFRQHVREPDVGDLHYIAKDLGMTDVKVLGRNWLGYSSRRRWARLLTPIFDRALQPFPTLCSDIYLLARKRL